VAVLGIKVDTWQGLRQNQRSVMRWAVARLALGLPAQFTDGVDEWFVFSDWRFDVEQIAILGALADALTGLPETWTPTLNPDSTVNRAATEAEVLAYVSPTIVWPDDIAYLEDDPNRWQTTLDAQTALASIRASGRVPDGYIPVDPEGGP